MSVITDTQEIEVKGPVEPRHFRPGNTVGPIKKEILKPVSVRKQQI